MNLKDLKKPFPAEEIEWRLSQAGKSKNGQFWGMCLAYVQARSIQDRLDQVCGPENWKVEYRFIPIPGADVGVICQLSLWCGDKWVMKEDGAEQTDIEAFKGGISGALKRAGSVWGIGRYLYGLEAGFVQIVEKGMEGAKYGQTKEKEGFYWIPPKLPGWALPESDSKQKNGGNPVSSQDGQESQSHSSLQSHPQKGERKPSEAQIKRLYTIAGVSGWSELDVKTLLDSKFKINSVKDLVLAQYDPVCEFIKNHPKPAPITEAPLDWEKEVGPSQVLSHPSIVK